MENDPLLGQNLGNFRVERLIGRGGMASVYYGWDSKLQRPAAIKAIDVSQRDIAYAKRLVQEARIIARWRHEHICQVYTADQIDKLYFFAMEYIDGLDVAELLGHYHDAGELIPHADVIRIGRAVASALDFAHQHGVIHRDVKPSNIMLDGEGRIVLTDFGLALDVKQGTMGEVLGTPHYVAPEQAQDSSRTVPQSDLYSLGVILYEALTGSVPFDDPSPMSLALQHITNDPPLPTSLNASLNIPTEAVLLKAMSKRPEDRYSTGETLMDALEAALAHNRANAPADPRLRTPVADVLVERVRNKATLPARGLDDQSAGTVTVRLARQKATRQQNMRLWGLLGGAAVFVVVAVIAIALGTGLLSPASPDGSLTVESSPATRGPTEATVASGQPSVTAPDAQASATAEAPQPSQPATPVALGPTGSYQVLFIYNERGFYVINDGDRNLDVTMFAFEAVNSATGQPTDFHFAGKSWAEFHSTIEKRGCGVIEILGSSAYQTRPAECVSFNAQRTPSAGSTEIFWIARPDVAEFRVLWAGQEIARCAIVSGRCEVYLP